MDDDDESDSERHFAYGMDGAARMEATARYCQSFSSSGGSAGESTQQGESRQARLPLNPQPWTLNPEP